MKAFRLLLLCMLCSVYTWAQSDIIAKRVTADTVKAKDYRFQSKPAYSILKALESITGNDSTLNARAGTTAQRPTVPPGKYIIRYNLDSSGLEVGNPAQQWKLIGQSSDSTQGTNGITELSNNVLGLGGTITQPTTINGLNNPAVNFKFSNINNFEVTTTGYIFSIPPAGNQLQLGSPSGASLLIGNTNNYIQQYNGLTYTIVSPSFIEMRVRDSLKVLNLSTVDDTTTWKPMVQDSRGNIAKFSRWVGTGGSSGSVTAVGLQMPAAFSVANTPITDADTFVVTMVGSTAQYLRGNGTLATFDTTAIPDFFAKVRSVLTGTSPITYNTASGAIGIQTATSSQPGALSAADHVLFSSKLGDPGGNGLVARTAAGTTLNRTLITPDANNITLLNPSGVAGNPSIDVGPDIAKLSTNQTFTGNKQFDNKVYMSSAPTYTPGADDNALITLGYLLGLPADTIKVKSPNLEVFVASGSGEKDTLALNDTVTIRNIRVTETPSSATISDSALVVNRATGEYRMQQIAGRRFGIEDNLSDQNRFIDFDDTYLQMDSMKYLSFSTHSSALFPNHYGSFFFRNDYIELMSRRLDAGTSSWGFIASPTLTQMHNVGVLAGHSGFVQADTMQVILESEPYRLYLHHDSVVIRNNGGSMDLRIWPIPYSGSSSMRMIVVDTVNGKFYRQTIPAGGGGGVTTMTAIGSSPNADGATISGANLTLQPASGSFGGVVTTGNQTFAGEKTHSAIILNGGANRLQINDQSGGEELNITNVNQTLVFNARQDDFNFRDVFKIELEGPANGFQYLNTGTLRLAGLDTDGSAPTTSGTVRMTIVDGNGQLSFAPVPGSSSLQKEFLGNLYKNTSWANLDDFVQSGSTFTTSSGSIVATNGTADVFTNTIGVTQPSMLEKWTAQVRVIATSLSGSSGGFGIGLKSTNTYAAQSSALGRVYLSGADAGKVALYGDLNNDLFAKSDSAISFSAGDTIDLVVERDRDVLKASVQNITTNSSVYSVSIQYRAIGTPGLPNTGRYSVYNFGGTQTLTIDSVHVYSKELKHAEAYLLGNSKTQVYNATRFINSYANRLNEKITVVNGGGGADGTAEMLSRVREIGNLVPKKVYLADLMSNDQRFGMLEATARANYQKIVDSLHSYGLSVIHLGPFYETSIDLSSQYNWIRATFPADSIVDCYKVLQDAGNALHQDGIHINDTGHELVYNKILSSFKTLDADKTETVVNDGRAYQVPIYTGSRRMVGSDSVTYLAGTFKIGEYAQIGLDFSYTGASVSMGRKNGFPVVSHYLSTAGTNEKLWDNYVFGPDMFFRAINDAVSGASNWMRVNRTGTTVNYVALPGSKAFIGTETDDGTSGKLQVAGNISTPNSIFGVLSTLGDFQKHSGFGTSGTAGEFYLRFPAGATDQKVWDTYVTANSINYRTVNDNNTAAEDWFKATRSGINIQTIEYPSGRTLIGSPTDDMTTRLQVNGNGLFSAQAMIGAITTTDKRLGVGYNTNDWPYMYWRNLSGGADAKLWDWYFDASGNSVMRAINDANSGANDIFTIHRTGHAIDYFRHDSKVRLAVADSSATVTGGYLWRDPANGEIKLGMPAAGGGGDFSTSTSSVTDGQALLFDGTTGKLGKAFTASGVVLSSSGVLSGATLDNGLELSGTTFRVDDNYLLIGSNYINIRQRLRFDTDAATDADYDATNGSNIQTIIKLVDITANRTVFLPTGTIDGMVYIVHNGNTSGSFQWAPNPVWYKSSDGTSISTLANDKLYVLVGIGTKWYITNH